MSNNKWMNGKYTIQGYNNIRSNEIANEDEKGVQVDRKEEAAMRTKRAYCTMYIYTHTLCGNNIRWKRPNWNEIFGEWEVTVRKKEGKSDG